MSDDYCLGIDLGTTNSLGAVWVRGEDRPRVLPITQPYDGLSIQGFRRDEILSSAVAILPEGVFVGFAAKQLGRLGRGTVITSIKRHMGSHWARNVAGRTWTPEAVSACILKAILREAETTFRAPPRQVVITVPASFGTEARRATLKAAALAGFDPHTTRLFDEPTAALLQQLYLQREEGVSRPIGGPGGTPGEAPRRLMMIDIGGGTLDVSLLELRCEGERLVADIQGRSRYNELAGDDFDLQIAGLILARYEHARNGQAGQPYSLQDERRDLRRNLYYEMLLRAEEVKMRLSRSGRGRGRGEFAQVVEPVVLTLTPDGKPWRTSLNLAELAEVLHKFFPFSEDEDERRQDFSFFRPIQQCLDSVHEVTGRKLRLDEVDQVYLAGGSALLPMVPVAVQRILSQKPRVVANPLQAVALGAAWYAGLLGGYPQEGDPTAELRTPLVVRERLFDGLYLEADGGSFVQVLSPREEVPLAERTLDRALTTSRHDRRIEVALYMGSGPDDVHMVPLARRRVDFGTLLPEGQPIRLALRVSENRQAEFAFFTEWQGQPLQGRVEVSAALGWEGEDDPAGELPEINRPAERS